MKENVQFSLRGILGCRQEAHSRMYTFHWKKWEMPKLKNVHFS